MLKLILLATLFVSQNSFALDEQYQEIDQSIQAEITEGKIQAALEEMVKTKAHEAWTLVFTAAVKLARVKDGNFQQNVVDELNIIIKRIEAQTMDKPEQAISVFEESSLRLKEIVAAIDKEVEVQNK